MTVRALTHPTPAHLPAHLPLAMLLGLMIAAHAPALPGVAWPILLLAAASRWLPARHGVAALRLVALLGIYAAAALAWGWFASETLRLSVLAVLLLKWAESKSTGEDALVAAAALVAVAIGSLNWSEVGALGWIALALPCVLLALRTPNAEDLPGRRNRPDITAALCALRMPLRHLAAALPLAGVLFIFFPRIPGPLWDIGLSFGLPLAVGIDQSPQGLGVSASLKPGQTQGGAAMASATPVLVAEFENWVPPTSQLYWRGPVFYDFDGQEWKLDSDIATNGRRFMPQGWRSARRFGQEQLAHAAQEIRYTIRLSPHQATWLYALDLPSGLPTEAFVGPDWQVISHTPVDKEMTYRVSSWLEWTALPEIPPELRRRALALPADGNPRLRQLGEQLRDQGDSERKSGSDGVVRAALAELARGGFTVRDAFEAPQGADALDAFWFDTRTGNAEFFAGAFVYLMRAAGVPARLVTGYRGGKLMALTDYVVVKRSHAHAWVEVWDEVRGWRRIDPVDVVTLQKRPETGATAREREKPADTAPAPRDEGRKDKHDETNRPLPNGDFAERAPAVNLRLKQPASQPSLLEAIGDWIGRWIVRLDAERQLELLAGKGGGLAWAWLLLGALFAATTIALAAIGLARWRDARRQPPAQRAWQRACRLLARHGLPPAASECPHDFARRVAAARPELATGMHTLADAYAGWRYGKTPEQWPATVTKAARYLTNLIQALPAPRPIKETTEIEKK